MLIGVLLAVAAMPVSSKQQKKNTAGEQNEDMQKSVLEEKLETLLENTEGVGKVQVILMTDEKKGDIQFLCYRSSRNLNRLSISFVLM